MEEIKQLLLNQQDRPVKKSKAEKEELDVLKLYVPKHKTWDEMGITKDQWKKYRGSIWVYAPSIKKFFEDKNVNKG